MYESGDYIIPKVQDRPRLNKPPLIYWLQCASIAVFGDREGQYPNANIWVFRVPSVLAAMASVFMTWRFGLRFFDPRAALLAAALLAVAPMVVWDAHQARADQVLMATVIATQWALYEIWRSTSDIRHPPSHIPHLPALAFWLSLSLGILTKGPITPLIACLTILSLSFTTRNWRWTLNLRPILGLAIVTALVGPWVYAVAQRVGWSTYFNTIYAETIGRSAEAKEGHWGPPGYHTVLLCILFWPGVLMTAAAVKRAYRRTFSTSTVPLTCPQVSAPLPVPPTGPPVGALLSPSTSSVASVPSPVPPTSRSGLVGAEPPKRAASLLSRLRSAHPTPHLFLLAWLLPAWIVFELIATKLPHYTMPMYPAIALLSARTIFAASSIYRARSTPLSQNAGFAIWIIVGFLLLGLVIIGPLMHHDHSTLQSVPIVWIVGFGLAALAMAYLARLLGRGQFIAVQFRTIIILAPWAATVCGIFLPSSSELWLSKSIADSIPSSHDPVILSGYQEDSLVFQLRGRCVIIPLKHVRDVAMLARRSIVVCDTRHLPESDADLPHRVVLARFQGTNYSNGLPVTPCIFGPSAD